MAGQYPSPLAHLQAGALSGVSTVILFQPLDLLKTRVQQKIINPGTLGTLNLKKRNVPGTSIFFYILYLTRRTLGSLDSQVSENPQSKLHTTLSNIFSGAFSRAAAGFVLMPATVLKVRYESSYYNFTGILPALKSIYATRGIRGFFDGAVSTAIRDAPYAGIYFAIYESTKRFGRSVSLHYNLHLPEPVITATSGMIGGITASYITQPFDVVKTRMQIKPDVYHNVMQSFKKIYREEGIYGFFRGISLRILRKGIQASISFSLYEWATAKN
ncbi:hypothetical protein BB560_002498 [Smittium megazygosporum]|uniref:Solute carrier family 25 member 38 homolog n=1 Tax=Smittium megazygosporum TaxID=133381 RepID=A0A2T9ZEJ8_9FUNG|nr:hypothetical protein BB560_002498 [Smittium megazygosporum]